MLTRNTISGDLIVKAQPSSHIKSDITFVFKAQTAADVLLQDYWESPKAFLHERMALEEALVPQQGSPGKDRLDKRFT